MSSKPLDPQAWLPLWSPKSPTRLRLLCFPYAGAGASAFRALQSALDADFEVCAVEYPGRWSRHREPCIDDVERLAQAALRGLEPLFSRPFALFGYSFGALIAHELAHALQPQQRVNLRHLIVAARPAPQLPLRQAPLHTLADDAFIDGVNQRYNAIPDAVRRDPELLAMILPALRADMRALERHAQQSRSPLTCPLTALGGKDDRAVTADDLQAWSEQTSASFAAHTMEGGHFFLNTQLAPLSHLLRKVLLTDSPNEQVRPWTQV